MTRASVPTKPPPPPAAKSGDKSGVQRGTGLKLWPTAPAALAAAPEAPAREASTDAAPETRPATAAPRGTGLKLWPSEAKVEAPAIRHSDPDLRLSDRPTIPPELPVIELEPAPGVVVAGKYRLERLLKHGGMGSVWVASQLDLDRPVAVKFIAPRALQSRPLTNGAATPPSAGDPVELTRARFEREARAAARIRSVNVVQVYDHGVDRGLPYIVMELLEGEDLGTRLDRQVRFSIDEAAALLPSIAHAVQRAHDAGVVHRDLKPENVFIARDGDVEVIKILDFGVSKAIQGGAEIVGPGTLEGSLIGTPFYMSPEQAMGRPDVDHRADLWSLGVILYRVLTGRRPFASKALLESVVEIATAPIPPPSSVRPELSPEVDRFFERALARKPDDRFQSAKELAQAFCELRRGDSVAPLAASEPPVMLVAPPVEVAPAPDLFAPDTSALAPFARPDPADEDLAAPGRSSRKLLVVAGAVVLAALGAVVLLLSSGAGDTAAAASASAPATPSTPPPAAVPAPVDTVAPAASTEPSAAASTTATAVPSGKWPPGAFTAPPGGTGAKKKGRRDVGY